MSEFAKVTDTAKAEHKTNMTAAAIAEHNYRGLFADFKSQREWLINAITEYSTEREAQVRAEEREKVKGVVEAVTKAYQRLCSGKMKEELIAVSEIHKALATYNDNRKG